MGLMLPAGIPFNPGPDPTGPLAAQPYDTSRCFPASPHSRRQMSKNHKLLFGCLPV